MGAAFLSKATKLSFGHSGESRNPGYFKLEQTWMPVDTGITLCMLG